MSSRILGIDPGFDRLGLAVIEGSASRPQWVWSACVIIPKGTREARLSGVFRAVHEAIESYAPDAVAIETLFFSVNKKTAIAVAEARGAALAAAGNAGIFVDEYSPQQIKIAVTGTGRADKKAVAAMVSRLITLPARTRRIDDEFDAIATALCGLAHRNPHLRRNPLA